MCLYSFFEDFCICFNEVDVVVIVEVFVVGEDLIKGVMCDDLVDGLIVYGYCYVCVIVSEDDLVCFVKE